MAKNKEIVGSPKGSRSVRRTKMALRNSLIELMKTRSILRISITEICEEADVGRSTFYAHYENQYDLLEELEMDCLSAFEETLSMNQPLRKYNNQEVTKIFERMLQFIADNNNSIQILLNENGEVLFQRKFINHLIGYFKYAKKMYADGFDEKTSECYSVFFINGALALIQHWLKNNMHIPVHVLAKMLLSLTSGMR